MGNTTYFEPYRDDDDSASTTSKEEDSDQATTVHKDPNHASSSSLPLYSVIYRAFSGCLAPTSGFKSKDSGTGDNDSGSSLQFVPRNLNKFSFEELKNATRNFGADVKLGEGGFGQVYKGWIDENTLTASKPGRGIAVAIKSLDVDSVQGYREWLAEVNFLGRLHHPNLVRLQGYCSEEEKLLLVYEYISLGNLESNLFKRGSSSSSLSWSLRMKVALGAAKGLAFLHRADINVICRDFKSSNILLDSDYNPKISDFGLAMLGPTNGMSYVSTRIMGTQGYSAPEYMSTGHLTAKCDVYSFGVVLLELLSGQQAFRPDRPSGEQCLVKWAKPYLRDKYLISRVLDRYLDGQYTWESARKAAKLALHCVATSPKSRPRMNEVVTVLKQLQGSNS
ncbi:putative serine/threonine-protein kinase pbl10 [Ranunculus cassubicifolius]